MKPFWVTFYSYKGGVGRSMALANTAALLVQQGRRVLLIDFDLEAPGLDSFAEFAPAAGTPGVVEYVSEFLSQQRAPDIRTYVHRCELPGPLRGQLWLMPAGRRDAAYNRQLSRLSWAELYERGLGEPFVANWKAAIAEHFEPDYVFIDSRTGLTEVGGICTTQFPDLVVMLFGLNEQNVRGTATVAQSIRESDPDRVPQMHFVATPVPNFPPDPRGGSGDKRIWQERRSQFSERLDAAGTLLGVNVESTIRYYAPASLYEKLFVLEKNTLRQSIVGDYERLSSQITQFNRTGLDFLITQAEAAISKGDSERIERLSAVLERDYSDRPESLFVRSRFALHRNHIDRALALAEQSLDLDPAYSDPFNFLCSHYTRTHRHDKVVELAGQLLRRAERIAPDAVYAIEAERAPNLMALEQYAEAAKSYSSCIAYANEHPESSSNFIIHLFNAAEAQRRNSKVLDAAQWKKIAKLFSLPGASSDSPSPTQANRLQAMHIAFACAGDLPAAQDALRKAKYAAESVGEVEDVFTVKFYREVPVRQFIDINNEMLAALSRGELWDGMKLPH